MRAAALITIGTAFALFCGAASAQSSESEASRLSGNLYSWTLAVGEGQCREDWSFGADGVLTVTSGEEVTTSGYALTPAADSIMFELRSTRRSSNGRPDCQRHSNAEVGQTHLLYLMFLNGGGFFTCGSTDTMSCYGVATPIARP